VNRLLRRLRTARHAGAESGMTLVELIVSSAIAVVLLTFFGSILISSLRVQNDVLGTTSTTNEAKVQFDALEQAARLAVETDVRDASAMSTEPASGEGNVLILKSRVNQGAVTNVHTWQCVAWYLDGSGNLHKVRAAAQTSGTPVTATNPSTWPVVVDGVDGVSGSAPFTLLEADPAVASWYPGTVSVALEFRVAQSKVAVSLTSEISPRRQLQLDGEIPGGVPCV
jgi:hypothetical protein